MLYRQHGADKAVGFPHTAYCLPCYYAVTGVKIKTLGELQAALGVVKSLMTREHALDDALMSGVATALCAEFIEALKYLDGAEPYQEPCYGHLADSIIRELGVPLVTGAIPGVAVILGSAPTAQEGVDLIKSYQAQGILVTLVGGIIDQAQELGLKMGYNFTNCSFGKRRNICYPRCICCTSCSTDLRQCNTWRCSKPSYIHQRQGSGICKCFQSLLMM